MLGIAYLLQHAAQAEGSVRLRFMSSCSHPRAQRDEEGYDGQHYRVCDAAGWLCLLGDETSGGLREHLSPLAMSWHQSLLRVRFTQSYKGCSNDHVVICRAF